MSPGWAVMELGVNWNLLFAATVTIMVAAEAVKLWAKAASTMLEKSILKLEWCRIKKRWELRVRMGIRKYAD
jgi:hypothetical protein